MDDINGLPDDLLLKILSFVPTKVAVSTCVLSKRWEFFWMWLPKLEYISMDPRKHGVLGEFIDKQLPLHRAPVVESLLLELSHNSLIKPEDIKRWVEVAVSCYVRQLEICYYTDNENILPSNLFTCKSLVTLKLFRMSIMDVPSMVWLPSLKTLQVAFVDGKSFQQLLSGCPVLEDLSVQDFDDGNFTDIIIPSLQSLSVFLLMNVNSYGYEIDTPSLKYLKLVDCNYTKHYSLIKNMPKLREAYVDVRYSNHNTFNIGSITSVKRLTICAEDLYDDGCVFKELEHLNLCVCNKKSSKLLGKMLTGSPNLRVLDLSVMKNHGVYWCNGTVCWNQSCSVPECLLSTLQVFKWSRYIGRPQDRDIAVYILKNAFHLKKAAILVDTKKDYVTRLEIIKELTLSPRASSTCQLVFTED